MRNLLVPLLVLDILTGLKLLKEVHAWRITRTGLIRGQGEMEKLHYKCLACSEELGGAIHSLPVMKR